MVLVAVRDDGEAEEGQEDEEHVAQLASLLPRRDLSRVCLLIKIVNATVQPVTVPIDMEFVEVTEFVQRMVFQIVNDNLVLFCRLRLVLKSIGSHHS